MFSKILGRKKNEAEDSKVSELAQRVAQMNLTDMRSYINNKVSGLEVDEDGVIEVLKKLVHVDENSKKRYIEIDDMDSKIKKGFDLLLTISEHKRMTVSALELMQEFITLYDDIIKKYDTDHKEIYASRFRDALERAMNTIEKKSQINNKQNVLGN